jgi:hypothetical protein
MYTGKTVAIILPTARNPSQKNSTNMERVASMDMTRTINKRITVTNRAMIMSMIMSMTMSINISTMNSMRVLV